MGALPENLLLQVVSEIHDPVTTTDELIPSGETSAHLPVEVRSGGENPLIGRRGRNRAGIHQGNGGNLTVLKLAALPIACSALPVLKELMKVIKGIRKKAATNIPSNTMVLRFPDI